MVRPQATPASTACSGLTHAAFAAAGIRLPRTAHTQYYRGPLVARGAPLLPGDLVFYGVPQRVHHVGLCLGGGLMVNAPRWGKPVQVAPYRWPGDGFLGATRPTAGGAGILDLLPDIGPLPDIGLPQLPPAGRDFTPLAVVEGLAPPVIDGPAASPPVLNDAPAPGAGELVATALAGSVAEPAPAAEPAEPIIAALPRRAARRRPRRQATTTPTAPPQMPTTITPPAPATTTTTTPPAPATTTTTPTEPETVTTTPPKPHPRRLAKPSPRPRGLAGPSRP
jgi:hypothetical protein